MAAPAVLQPHQEEAWRAMPVQLGFEEGLSGHS